MKRLSALAIASMVISNPLMATAQVAYNPAVQNPGKFGLSRTKSFESLGRATENGGFFVTDPKTLEALGYDPSRTWKAGDAIADIVQVGDVDGLLNIKDLTPRQLAEQTGLQLNQIPLEGIFGRQTLGDLVKLNPQLANTPIEAIPAIRSIATGQWNSAVTSGLQIASRYSPELNKVLQAHPELANLPLESVLRGNYTGLLDTGGQLALKELSKQLPQEFQALPAQSIPALQSLVNGDISGFAAQGFSVAIDRSKVLRDLVARYPALEQIPIGDIVRGDWNNVLSRGQQLALKELERQLPADVKRLTGEYAPLVNAIANKQIGKAAVIGAQHIKAFNQFLEANPHLKDVPLDRLLQGDVQAALPIAQQVAIFEISKALPAQYRGLPGDSLSAINALSQGNWESAIAQGVRISAREVQAVSKLFEKHPELAELKVEQILKGDFSSALSIGERKALEELAKVNPYLGELPIRDILNGNFKSTLNKGVQIAGKELIGQVLKDNPALQNIAVGVIDGNLKDIPGLADTALSEIKGIDGAKISEVPGLKNVPLENISANTIAALIKGDLFGHLDLPLGEKEMIARNTLSGGTRGKKLTPQPCQGGSAKVKNCSHIELTDKNGTSLDGKQFVKGSSQQVKGGWGFLKDVANNGYEKTGIAPWGVSRKTHNLKLVINEIKEVGDGSTTTPSGFRVATGAGYAEFGLTFGICIKKAFVDLGCTSSFIDLPLEYFPKEILDLKVAEKGRVLIATSSPPPRIPKSLLKRYRRELGYPDEEDYCDVPATTQPTNDGTYKDADQSDLVQVGDYRGRPEYLHKDTAKAWERMKADAAKDGVSLDIGSGHRSVADQEAIWQHKRDEGQSDEEIAKVNTKPGKSEHHTGYVVDIIDGDRPDTDFNNGFRNTKAGDWLAKNASKYGFEKSYPKEDNNGIQREEWHWRYVGNASAKQALNLGGGHSSGDGHNHDGDKAIASVRAPKTETEQFVAKTVALANKYGLKPEELLTVMSFETGGTFSPAITNSSGYTGLIQFGYDTARDLGTSTAALRRMSRVEQLDWVDRYFAQRGLPKGATTEQLYATVLVGNPGGNLHATDSNGTSVYSAVQRHFPAHRQKAIALLKGAANLDTSGYNFASSGVTCVASAGGSEGSFSQGSGKSTGRLINPVPGYPTTSEFGPRRSPCAGCSSNHQGLDFSTPIGTPVKAADGGKVDFAGWVQGYGNVVIIGHGNGLGTMYAHLDSYPVKVGDSVSQGQVIARSGQTGVGTGPHLHVEVYEGYQTGNHRSGVPVNPRNHLRVLAMRILLPIVLTALMTPVVIALESEELKACQLPDIFRFQTDSATAIALVEDNSERYVFIELKGHYYPVDRNPEDTIPAVYKLSAEGCELIYLNASGHDTPLENSMPKHIADSLTEQVEKQRQ